MKKIYLLTREDPYKGLDRLVFMPNESLAYLKCDYFISSALDKTHIGRIDFVNLTKLNILEKFFLRFRKKSSLQCFNNPKYNFFVLQSEGHLGHSPLKLKKFKILRNAMSLLESGMLEPAYHKDFYLKDEEII